MDKKIMNLFVYGTLRRGFHNPVFQYISDHFHFVSDGKIKGTLYDLGEYPAAVPSDTDNRIVGEMYEANSIEEFNWAISQLDDYEGLHPEEGEEQLYRRELATVDLNDDVADAWVYWYNGSVSGMPVIDSGDVLEYFKSRNK
jgi:gamma-glutamylcyclotransferase (GGCT)/AIG2-like uncharacterized protein YtfP